MKNEEVKNYTEKEERDIIQAILDIDFKRMPLSSIMALVTTIIDDHAGLTDCTKIEYMSGRRMDLRANLSNEILKYVILSKGVKHGN